MIRTSSSLLYCCNCIRKTFIVTGNVQQQDITGMFDYFIIKQLLNIEWKTGTSCNHCFCIRKQIHFDVQRELGRIKSHIFSCNRFVAMFCSQKLMLVGQWSLKDWQFLQALNGQNTLGFITCMSFHFSPVENKHGRFKSWL